MEAAVDTRPVGPAELADLGRLFAGQRSTRNCWCTAFCTTRGQFAAGWFGSGNRRRFAAMAAAGTTPMGVLASVAGQPVGWCACGPRSRYPAAARRGSPLLADGVPADEPGVWLLPCLVVHPAYRGQGVTHALVRAAVEVARGEGARAIESWPLAASVGRSADAFLGREELFTELGFRSVRRPGPARVVMRRELDGG